MYSSLHVFHTYHFEQIQFKHYKWVDELIHITKKTYISGQIYTNMAALMPDICLLLFPSANSQWSDSFWLTALLQTLATSWPFHIVCVSPMQGRGDHCASLPQGAQCSIIIVYGWSVSWPHVMIFRMWPFLTWTSLNTCAYTGPWKVVRHPSVMHMEAFTCMLHTWRLSFFMVWYTSPLYIDWYLWNIMWRVIWFVDLQHQLVFIATLISKCLITRV